MKTIIQKQLGLGAIVAWIMAPLGCCEKKPSAGALSPVPDKFIGAWFDGEWGRGDKGERITLKVDWTFERYVRFDADSKAIGKFYIRSNDTVVLVPKYYAIDAKRCGGSSERELTFAKKGGRTCLTQTNRVYWKDGRPPGKP